ncbi:MAG: hypothetical protein EP330_16290 [Deltaproteobacteria bacterium]|nr:MAG: hypothetical protein EP330_16290 [Deltaproteobacteria bacterium]
MQLDVDLDETNPFCGPFGVGAAIKDCTMVWEGTADTVVERCRPPERITMEGTFSRTSSDCDLDPNDSQPAILEQGTWGNEDNPSSYISLVMSQADPGFLETVIGHKFITRWRPTESPVSDQQYYETDIPSVTFSNGQTVIDYVGTTIEPVKNCPITYTSTVRVDINQ